MGDKGKSKRKKQVKPVVKDINPGTPVPAIMPKKTDIDRKR